MKVTIGVDPNGPLGDLNIAANVLLRFRTDRRWIDARHFTFVEGLSDLQLLAALVAHRQFRDAYMGGATGEAHVHGPYSLDAVTPDRYESIPAIQAVAWLDDFCGLYGIAPSHALGGDIDTVVRQRLSRVATLFRLPELEDARHDFASVLEEFRELVLVDRGTMELSLIVLGID